MRNGRASWALPTASALLLTVCVPPWSVSAAAFVALAPFGLFVAGCAPDRVGTRRAAMGGGVLGAIHFGLVFGWILPATAPWGLGGVPPWLATVAGLSGVSALVGAALHRATVRGVLPAAWGLPLAWTGGEWLRGHAPGSLANPWVPTATALSGWPEAAGMAEWVGASGLTFWLAAVAGLLVEAVVRLPSNRGGAARWLVAAFVVAALPVAWGSWRAGTLSLVAGPRVAVVGTAVSRSVPRGRPWADSTVATLDRLLPRVAPGSVDLVVLPESALPLDIGDPDLEPALAVLSRHAVRLDVPLLFGALAPGPSGRPAAYNSAFAMTPTGLARFRYDKRHLVPVVERVPLMPEGFFGEHGRWGFMRGREASVLALGGVTFGVLICYESAFPGAARSLEKAGADVLVNVTNEAWFGTGPHGRGTSALAQHPAHLVLRAIETRTPWVRAANGGASMVVDPAGRVVSRLEGEGVAVATVSLHPGRTPYARIGDVVGPGSALVILLFGVLGGGGPVHRQAPRSG